MLNRSLLAASLFLSLTTLAQAQEQAQGRPPQQDWTISAGAASLYAPAFTGSKDYNLSVMPDLRVQYKDRLFASVPEGLGYNVVTRAPGQNGWKIGPLAKVEFGRDEDGENAFTLDGGTNALRGMGDIDATLEVGGFVDYRWGVVQSRLELRQGFGGHEGFVADANLNYADNVGPVRFSVGPRLTYASQDYNQTYFGINAAQSAGTGLAQYNADGGLVSYGFGAFAMMPLAQALSLTAFGGYDWLGDEAADSPLVRQRGDDQQLSLGLGLSYRFGFNEQP